MRYGMVLDLTRCIGCDACTVACKQVHGTGPGVFWSRVIKSEFGAYPTSKLSFQPILCNHCEDPSCAKVCPVRATFINDDGIVMIDENQCIGCRYCMAACPYDARTFIDTTKKAYFVDKDQTAFESIKYAEHTEGTVQKCTFCAERIENPDMLPACVQTCPASARLFGDLDDPNSDPSLALSTSTHTQLRPEAGTKPKVYYI